VKKAIFFMGLFAVTLASILAQNTALPRLGVMAFSTNINTVKINADAITVRDLVERHMQGTGRYRMISREEIDRLMLNQNIQEKNISSAENIQKLKLENVNYIVTGSVNAMDNDYSITVKILDVSNGVFSHIEDAFMGSGSRDLYNGINGLMAKFLSGMSTAGGRVTQADSNKTYRIGDTGPAGGIIFYDKGSISDGWRYLEAAPAEKEFTAQWGTFEENVSGTGTAIGNGKRNTQIIVDILKSLGENNRAAQVCTTLDINGYKDWFLPSTDELNLMYKNLAQKGLGGFGSGWYWSSSQSNSNFFAWAQMFSNGYQYSSSKNFTFSVRAVRAF